MFLFGKKINPSINYVWVGKPPQVPIGEQEVATTAGLQVRGHDITEPLNMAKANDTNPIVFWCLEEYVDHYKREFAKTSPGKKIEVRSIEGYINELESSSDEQAIDFAEKMKSVMEGCLAPGRGIVRDLVTIKDAFVLLLHATMPNSVYTLDTNISIGSGGNKKIALSDSDKFLAPLADVVTEVWMLFSSSKNKLIPQTVFENFYDEIQKAERHFKKHGSYDDKFQSILSRISDRLKSAILINEEISSHFATRQNPDDERQYSIPLTRRGMLIEEGNHNNEKEAAFLVKTYNNTHKLRNRAAITDSSQTQQSYSNQSPSTQYDQKESEYKVVLLKLKNYIEQHNWIVTKGVQIGTLRLFENTGGSNHPTDKSKSIPNTVRWQWDVIHDVAQLRNGDNRAWQNAYTAIVNDARQKCAENKFEILGIGKRDQDTISYLKAIADVQSPRQLFEILEGRFALESVATKQDDASRLNNPFL